MRVLHYKLLKSDKPILPNIWDGVIFILIFAILAILAWGAKEMSVPYHIGDSLPISLEPSALPNYAAHTILRMVIALIFSLLFTFTVGTCSAKYDFARKIIIPAIDILQSIPILGMLSISIVGFIRLFPNSRLGPECAAIFVIFTSQVWNITLSFHQSLRILPKDLKEATTMLHLTPWQRFWHLEVPFSLPALLWNIMMSLSASWFFVVASEAIYVAHQNIMLPGIGSYIAKAILEANKTAILYALLTMFIVILLYDQIIFRPLLQWAQKFKLEEIPHARQSSSWVYDIFTKTILFKHVSDWIKPITDFFINPPRFKKPNPFARNVLKEKPHPYASILLFILKLSLIASGISSCVVLVQFVITEVEISEVIHVFFLGGITALKVIIMVILASLFWVPLGVWIGLHPTLVKIFQPIAQFLAAFPANLLYPAMAVLLLHFQLNIEIWTAPLMILGTQWYILFNVIAGISAIPEEIHLITKNLELTGWLWWKKLILPSVLPYYVTGAMAAAGGAWNASIVAEVVQWGNQKFIAQGLGSYIAEYTANGDFARLALGISIMALYVLVMNRLLWHKLSQYSESRYAFG